MLLDLLLRSCCTLVTSGFSDGSGMDYKCYSVVINCSCCPRSDSNGCCKSSSTDSSYRYNNGKIKRVRTMPSSSSSSSFIKRKSVFFVFVLQLITIQIFFTDHNDENQKAHLFCRGAPFPKFSLFPSSPSLSSSAFSSTLSTVTTSTVRKKSFCARIGRSDVGFLLPRHPFAFGCGNSRTVDTSTRSSSSSLVKSPTIGVIPSVTCTALPCQLLGMNCATPTDFTFSFKGFIKRGGETDIHSDGWGMAFYQNNGLRTFHDDQPASYSPLSIFLTHHPVRTLNMMSHIRYATVGKVDLSNVHPFTREMWGIQWCFSHNGDAPMFHHNYDKNENKNIMSQQNEDDVIYYHPVGTTDSEAIFCYLLNSLRTKFKTTMPSLPILYDEIQFLCNQVVQYDQQNTILNFLLSTGPNNLWAYSYPGKRANSETWNGLYYTVREYPFHTVQLRDIDCEVDFSLTNHQEDRVSIIATSPLTTDEEWIEIQKGELLLFDEGLPNKLPDQLFKVELHGHGLTNSSSVLSPPVLEEDMRRYHFKSDFFVGEGI